MNKKIKNKLLKPKIPKKVLGLSFPFNLIAEARRRALTIVSKLGVFRAIIAYMVLVIGFGIVVDKLLAISPYIAFNKIIEIIAGPLLALFTFLTLGYNLAIGKTPKILIGQESKSTGGTGLENLWVSKI